MTVDMEPSASFDDSQKTVYLIEANPNVPEPDDFDMQPMVRLMDGKEDPVYASTRFVIFQRFWSSKKRMIQEIMKTKNDSLFYEIAEYLQAQDDKINADNVLKSAFVELGSNLSSHPFILSNLEEYLNQTGRLKVVRLESKDCSRLKFALMSLIRQIIDDSDSGGEEEEDEDSIPKDGDDDMDVDPEDHALTTVVSDTIEARSNSSTKYLPYDFQYVVEWLEANKALLPQIVVVFEDSELFDPQVLELLLTQLGGNSIAHHFKLIFGISSSVALFEDSLTSHSIDLIEGKPFNLVNSHNLFKDITDKILFDLEIENNQDFLLLLGPNLLNQLASCEENEFLFFDILKYAYSVYFFSNPLSILNLVTIEENDDFEIDCSLIDALRRTPSFQKRITDLSRRKGKDKEILKLFQDDELLATEFKKHYRNYYKYGMLLYKLLDLLVLIQKSFNGENRSVVTKYQLYTSIIREPDFNKSRLYCHLTGLLVKNLSLLNLDHFLSQINRESFITHDDINSELGVYLLDEVIDEPKILLISRKLSELIDAHVTRFFKGFNEVQYKEIFTVEVQPDENTSIIGSAFNPFIRSRIETALINPNSYLLKLASEESSYDTIAKLIEPTLSELFALYRELTIAINIHDFFIAFKESIQRAKLVRALIDVIRQSAQDPDLLQLHSTLTELTAEELTPLQEILWEKIVLSWFYQLMSDLELLGFVKEAKKKSDSVEKLVWKGI